MTARAEITVKLTLAQAAELKGLLQGICDAVPLQRDAEARLRQIRRRVAWQLSRKLAE